MRIDIDDVKYLCFEGGGGKGAVYLGVVEALELLLPKDANGKIRPIIQKLKTGQDPTADSFESPNQIKGISGASAGAITAFMIALGKTSVEIQQIMSETEQIRNHAISKMEKWMDFPDTTELDNTKAFKCRSIHYKNGPLQGLDTEFVIGYKTFPWPPIDDRIPEFLYNLIENPKSLSIASFLLGDKLNSREAQVEIEKLKSNTVYKRLFKYVGENNQTTVTPFPTLNPSLPMIPVVGTRNIYKLNDRNKNKAVTFLTNFIYGSGLFLGYYVREFFVKHLVEYIKERSLSVDNIEALGFVEFYKLTGVDLKVTGTDVKGKRSWVFSKDETPNFPVIEAVAISMNFPFVFKPILCVNEDTSAPPTLSNLQLPSEIQFNTSFSGVEDKEEFSHAFVDGGALNNFPLHLFDEVYVDPETKRQHTVFNSEILGFNLKGDDTRSSALSFFKVFSSFFMDTVMYPANEGQIRTEQEKDQTIFLDAESIDTLNFSPTDEELYGKNRKDGPLPKAHLKTLEYFGKESLSKY